MLVLASLILPLESGFPAYDYWCLKNSRYKMIPGLQKLCRLQGDLEGNLMLHLSNRLKRNKERTPRGWLSEYLRLRMECGVDVAVQCE